MYLQPSVTCFNEFCPFPWSNYHTLGSRYESAKTKDYHSGGLNEAEDTACGPRGAVVSLLCSKAGQNQCRFSRISLWSDTNPTPTPPASHSIQELPSLPAPGTSWPTAFSCWLQRHPRPRSTTEHEDDCPHCLRRPPNQRARGCLGNYLAGIFSHG